VPQTRPIPTTVALLVGTFLSSMDVTVVGTALPRITGELGGLALYPWVFSIYLLTSTVTTPIWGNLADRRGRKPTYLWAIGIFLVGSAACGAAPTMGWLVAARAVQGLGAGAIVPLTMTVFGDIFPVEKRARMQGIFALTWGVSSIVGPAVGGLIVTWWSWPWVFYVNLPVGLVAMLVFAVNFHEVRSEHPAGPALPLDLLKDRVVAVSVGSGFLLGPMLFAFIAYVPLFLQGALGITPMWAGLATAPLSLAWTTATFLGGRWMLRSGYHVVVRAGMAILALGAATFWLALSQLPSRTGWIAFAAAIVLFGGGMGLTFSTFIIAVQERVPWERKGAVTALVTLSRSIGATLGVAALGAYITASLTHKLATVPGAPSAQDLLDPHKLARLSPEVLSPARSALGSSVVAVFAIVTAIGVVAALLTLGFPELRTGEKR
jgi:MFS family permease